MLLRAPVTVSAALSPWRQQDGLRNRVAENCRVGVVTEGRKNRGSKCSAKTIRAMGGESGNSALTGVIFEPFTEVQNELVLVSQSYTQSLARQRFSASCEAALNEQINVEYNVSYVYHALFAYFDRDNVSLPGFAKYFKDASDEERVHAEMLMKYQNLRGGRVKLQSIVMPLMEFDNDEKGDALYAMELALSLEKLTNEKLLNLHAVAQESNDSQMTDYLEGTFLSEQVAAIKRVAEYVSQLRRVGKGHGIWHFDQMLLAGQGAAVNGVAGGGAAAA